MLATVDYFGADQDNTTNAFDWWRAMAQNDAVFTSGWTEGTKSTTAEVTGLGWRDTLATLR